MSANQGIYAFWDLVAEEAYKPQNDILLKGKYKKFQDQDKNKKIWLFPCNEACRLLIDTYKDEWNIAGVLDNSQAKWGTDFNGQKVFAPKDTVPQMTEDNDVIILTLRL
jgi:FlaA1/EpsC-like NDP-sugar epimerase